eukprot:c17760_g1_i1 orf=1-585(-)
MCTGFMKNCRPRRFMSHMGLFAVLFLAVVALLVLVSVADAHSTKLHVRQIEEHQRFHVAQFYSFDGAQRHARALEEVDPLDFDNDRLRNAYVALQAWKRVIFSDPFNVTANWVGSDVCSYHGIFCADAPDDHCDETVAGIDLNHKDLAGFLPEELGLLTDLALIHLNTNRFCGKVPLSFSKLKLLHELDLSNNRF